ncbi:MAG: DUF6777 domain-containing protein [Acidimicrobiales bacterium]
MSETGGAGERGRNRTAIVVGSLVAAMALGAGLVLMLDDDGTRDVRTEAFVATTTTQAGFTQTEGEIFLEPAGSAGPDSFAGELFVSETTTIPSISTTAVTPTPAPTGPSTVSAIAGGTPALYGGSRDVARCDKAAQLRFLQQNPEKAGASTPNSI